jgi:hypothetical protein
VRREVGAIQSRRRDNAVYTGDVHEADLELTPNEASDLTRVLSAETLAERGWDRAFATVLDETCAEDCLALLVHEAGTELDECWHAIRVATEPTAGKGKTEDAEACAVRDGYLYVLGSQFGKKAGPLSARRSWIARVSEDSIAKALDGGKPDLEVVRLRFALHRAVNDALAEAAVELLPLGPRSRAAYIDATIALGAEQGKRWAGTVTSADHPINVEAAEFRSDGRLLLGLRYPTTADGHPILVELHDADTLFDGAEPRCGNVWVLDGVGDEGAPAGLRGLETRGDDRFDAIVGDLDAAGKSATVLEDHPEGGSAPSEHVRFQLPLTAGGGPVMAERVHGFGELRRVEGIAVDADGHAHYVIDEEGRVALRTLIFD